VGQPIRVAAPTGIGSARLGGASRGGSGGDSVCGHADGPAAFVDEVVVAFAEWQQVRDAGVTNYGTHQPFRSTMRLPPLDDIRQLRSPFRKGTIAPLALTVPMPGLRVEVFRIVLQSNVVTKPAFG